MQVAARRQFAPSDEGMPLRINGRAANEARFEWLPRNMGSRQAAAK